MKNYEVKYEVYDAVTRKLKKDWKVASDGTVLDEQGNDVSNRSVLSKDTGFKDCITGETIYSLDDVLQVLPDDTQKVVFKVADSSGDTLTVSKHSFDEDVKLTISAKFLEAPRYTKVI